MTMTSHSLRMAAVPLLLGTALHAAADESVLYDFQQGTVPDSITGNGVSLQVSDGALAADIAGRDNYYTAIDIRPDTPWDWSGHDAVAIAFDIANPGTRSVQLYLDIADANGTVATRSRGIPPGGAVTYHAPLVGGDLAVDTGMRDAPRTWAIESEKFHWMWGSKTLDVAAIERLSLYALSLAHDRAVVIDNVRVITDPPERDAPFDTLVDRYGQPIAADEAPWTVDTDADLARFEQAERDRLDAGPPPGRSRFGGWADGPRLEASGYFRTEKVDGRWALVDPEGYLFFSTGIANVRLANTSTVTGADFAEGAIEERKAEEVTPEDSMGLNPVRGDAVQTRRIVSPMRRDMFEWLPAYDDALGDHYGYRREFHSGPLEQGETYSFYRANLERKYGDGAENEDFLQAWQDVTVDRMRAWGFTSFGNWVDPAFYDDERMPYFANGWIIGDFKTVSSGNDYWAPLPDPFDPLFAERAAVTVQAIADQVQDSPWAIGVFVDNEKSWGRMDSVEARYGIVIDTLGRDAADSPTKATFVTLLQERHDGIASLNEAWGTEIESWEALAAGVQDLDHGEAQVRDYAVLLEAYATEYFRIVHDAMQATMPDHLYMGVRFATWGMTPEVRAAAAKYVDVMSYNEYREIPSETVFDFLPDLDKPSIIGEFHMGAEDSGLYHPGLVMATDQQDRARMFTEYMEWVIDNPWMVGGHWFQYIDSPVTGRAYDGENYNVGFVTVTDTPYAPMVEAAQALNTGLYERRFGPKAK